MPPPISVLLAWHTPVVKGKLFAGRAQCLMERRQTMADVFIFWVPGKKASQKVPK